MESHNLEKTFEPMLTTRDGAHLRLSAPSAQVSSEESFDGNSCIKLKFNSNSYSNRKTFYSKLLHIWNGNVFQ